MATRSADRAPSQTAATPATTDRWRLVVRQALAMQPRSWHGVSRPINRCVEATRLAPQPREPGAREHPSATHRNARNTGSYGASDVEDLDVPRLDLLAVLENGRWVVLHQLDLTKRCATGMFLGLRMH